MQTNQKASFRLGSKRTLWERLAVIGAMTLRLIIEGISARAQAIIGTRPHRRDR